MSTATVTRIPSRLAANNPMSRMDTAEEVRDFIDLVTSPENLHADGERGPNQATRLLDRYRADARIRLAEIDRHTGTA